MKPLVFFLSLAILQFKSGYIQAQSQDCLNGYVLCSSDQVNVNFLPIEKVNMDLKMPCFPGETVFNEATFFWTMGGDKPLEFDILPNDARDDIDFILYKLDRDNLDCEEWDVLRCMSTGPDLVDENLWMPCAGLTGLSSTSLNTESFYGCSYNASNYLSSVSSEAGELYALRVFNFTSYNGFNLRFKNAPLFAPVEDFPAPTGNLTPFDEDMIGSKTCIKRIGPGITSAEDIQNSSLVSVFPNPTNEQLFIIAKQTSIDHYRLINVSGNVISFNKLDGAFEFTVATSHLSTGVYLIELTDVNGVKYIKQFIKI